MFQNIKCNMTGDFVCPMLCLGRKGQTLDPLEPADTGLSRLHLIDVVFGPEGKFEKLFCKAIRCH